MAEPTWAEENWTPEKREQWMQIIRNSNRRELFAILASVISQTADSQYAAPLLVGAIKGAAAHRKRKQ